MKNKPEENGINERLRSLPALVPPLSGWATLERRLNARSQRRRGRLTILALAASILLTVGLLFAVMAPTPISRQPAIAAAPNSDRVAELMTQSRSLESSLAQLRPTVSVWDGESAEQAALLQRGLSIVDFQLAYAGPKSTQRLWQDRVDLLSNLVSTHREAGVVNASYSTPSENRL